MIYISNLIFPFFGRKFAIPFGLVLTSLLGDCFGQNFENEIVNLNKDFLFEQNILDSSHLLVFEDKESSQPHEILSKLNKFQKPTVKYPDNRGGKHDHWIYFKARFSEDCPDHLIDIHSPNVKLVELYLKQGDSLCYLGKTGAKIPIYDRPYNYKNLLIGLEARRGEVAEYFVKVHKGKYCRFDFFLTPYHQMLSYGSGEYLFLGIFYGLLIIMSLFKLILYFSLKDKVFIAYVALLFSAALKTLSEDRLGAQYIWKSYPGLSYWLGVHLAPWFVLFSFAWFVYSFLKLNIGKTPWCKWFIGSVVLNAVIHLVSLLVFNDLLNFNSLFFLPFLVLATMSFSSFRKKRFDSVYFILANFLFVGIIVIDLLRHQRIIFGNPTIIFSFYIFMFMQSLLLALSIFDRLKMLVNEKEKLLKNQLKTAQKKLFQELRNYGHLDTEIVNDNSSIHKTEPYFNTKSDAENNLIKADFVFVLKRISAMIVNDLDIERENDKPIFEFNSDFAYSELRFDPKLVDNVFFPIAYHAFLGCGKTETVKINVQLKDDYLTIDFSVVGVLGLFMDFKQFKNTAEYLKKIEGKLNASSQFGEEKMVCSIPIHFFSAVEIPAVEKDANHYSISENDNQFENNVNQFIEENIDNPELNVEAMVKELGMSRAQLYRKFTENMNMSVKDYINVYRVKKAMVLLEKENVSIKEVMLRVGFNNRNNFIKCFKEVHGVLPSMIKKKNTTEI